MDDRDFIVMWVLGVIVILFISIVSIYYFLPAYVNAAYRGSDYVLKVME
jgi:hypothetical protein